MIEYFFYTLFVCLISFFVFKFLTKTNKKKENKIIEKMEVDEYGRFRVTKLN